MDVGVCLCLCAHKVKMTPRSPAVNHTVVTRSRWPIKNPRANTQSQLCSEGPPRHSLPLRFHSSFPLPFSASRWATGVFSPHMDTHTHMNTCKKHMHTRTHKRRTAYYSLLICRALIETPLSPSHTCIPSLIISQGAFGGRREGDGGGWRGLLSLLWQASCTSTDLTELNLAASWCPPPLPSVGKKDAWSKTCRSMNLYVFSACLGWQ